VGRDTSFARAVEAIIHDVVRPRVEPAHEEALLAQMREAGVEPDRQSGFFHLYRALEGGIAYDGCAPDPYAGIEHPDFAQAVRAGCALVLVSHGWAAPGDLPDTAPADHPGRRKVRLSIVIEGLDRMTSVMRFADDPGDPLVETDGRGDLRDAIESRILDIVHSMG